MAELWRILVKESAEMKAGFCYLPNMPKKSLPKYWNNKVPMWTTLLTKVTEKIWWVGIYFSGKAFLILGIVVALEENNILFTLSKFCWILLLTLFSQKFGIAKNYLLFGMSPPYRWKLYSCTLYSLLLCVTSIQIEVVLLYTVQCVALCHLYTD